MTLLDEVLAVTDPRQGPCGVARFADTLDEADRADLDAAYGNEQVRTSAIHRVLARRGLTLRYDAVRKHRAGDCGCAR